MITKNNIKITLRTLRQAQIAFSVNLQKKIYSEIMVSNYTEFERVWDELIDPKSQKSTQLLLQVEEEMLHELHYDPVLHLKFSEWVMSEKEKGVHSFFLSQSIASGRDILKDPEKIDSFKKELRVFLEKGLKKSCKDKEKLKKLVSEQDKCVTAMWLASWNIFEKLNMNLRLRIKCAQWLKTAEAIDFMSGILLPETRRPMRSLSPPARNSTLSPPVTNRTLSEGNLTRLEFLPFPVQIAITPLWAEFPITLTPPYKQDLEVQEEPIEESKAEEADRWFSNKLGGS